MSKARNGAVTVGRDSTSPPHGLSLPLASGREGRGGLAAFAQHLHYVASADRAVSALAALMRRLEILFRAGIAPASAFEAEWRNARSGGLRAAMLDLCEGAREGEALSKGFARHEALLGKMPAVMVRAGEETGRLDESLRALAEHLEWESELRRKLSLWTLQAKLLFVCFFFLLPALWQLAMSNEEAWTVLSAHLLRFGAFVAALYLAAGIGRWAIFAHPKADLAYRYALIRFPMIGRVFWRFGWVRFARTLGDLYDVGVPPGQALEIAARVSRIPQVEETARRAALDCRDGRSFAESLVASGSVPPEIAQPLRTGEFTGEVVAMLRHGANQLQEDAEKGAMQAAFIYGQMLYLFVALLAASGILGGFLLLASRIAA